MSEAVDHWTSAAGAESLSLEASGRQFDARTRWTALAVLLALAFGLLWAAGMAAGHQAPPLDSAEQLVWSYAAEGGYWKHPPLPSWIMHVLVRLAGTSVALPFYATQAGIVIALLALWRVGCEWMDPARSLLAAALTALVGYHGWWADAFNHNSAMLPFQAGATAAFWFAVRRGSMRWWMLTGLCAGLAMLVKYVALLPLSALLLYVLLDRETRNARTLAGLAVAAAVAALVFAPHIAWLWTHNWQPVRYASALAVPLPTAAAWFESLGAFVGWQLVFLGPLLLVAGWMARTLSRDASTPPARPLARSDRLFLWTVGLAPLAFVLASSLVTRSELAPRWGYNVFLLAGWMVVDALRWPREAVAKGLRLCLALHVVLWGGVVVVMPVVSHAIGWNNRSSFPGQEFARQAHATWQAETGEPLRIVVSDVWLGGTLAAFNNGQPLAVLGDGEWGRAPWVTPQDVHACGALVVADEAELNDPTSFVGHWIARAPMKGEWQVAWAPSRGLRHLDKQTSRILWGIIPPASPQDCHR